MTLGFNIDPPEQPYFLKDLSWLEDLSKKELKALAEDVVKALKQSRSIEEVFFQHYVNSVENLEDIVL